jgi:hypothetical protein
MLKLVHPQYMVINYLKAYSQGMIVPTELDNLPTTALQGPVAIVSKGKKRSRRYRSAGEHGPGKYSIATM